MSDDTPKMTTADVLATRKEKQVKFSAFDKDGGTILNATMTYAFCLQSKYIAISLWAAISLYTLIN